MNRFFTESLSMTVIRH